MTEVSESARPAGVRATPELQVPGLLERGLATAWGRLAPLSVGAVAAAAAIVAGSVLIRGTLARRPWLWGWLATAALLPVGLSLAAARSEGEADNPEPGAERGRAAEESKIADDA